MRSIVIAAALLALAGCGTRTASTGASGTDATAAGAPQSIDITDQKKVYECPECGMVFDRAGKCPMDGRDLVAMDVSYTCPADNKPVEHAGKCPRCAMDARIDKTASLVSAPAGN